MTERTTERTTGRPLGESDRMVDALLRRISWSRFAAEDADAGSAAIVDALRGAGDRIAAAGGLDAVDEAILRITEMNPACSDQRARLLEALWSDAGRGEA